MNFNNEINIYLNSSNPELIVKFLKIIKKIYNTFYDKNCSKILKFQIEKTNLNLSQSWESINFNPSLIIFLSEDGFIINDNIILPHLIISFNENIEKAENNNHYLYFKELNKDSILSILSYSIIFSNCFNLGIHSRNIIPHKTILLLKRVFRSLDIKFISKITVLQFSEFHELVFGTKLSYIDLIRIYQSQHDGSEPLSVERYLNSYLYFDDFLKIFQSYVNKGYGSLIYQIIKYSKFHEFFQNENIYLKKLFNKYKPQRLTSIGENFLKNLYENFNDFILKEKLIEEFQFSGGIPNRFTLLKEINENNWIQLWSDWSILDPEETARQLLSLGFPFKLLKEAFGINKEVKNNSKYIILGSTITILSLTSLYLLKNKKK